MTGTWTCRGAGMLSALDGKPKKIIRIIALVAATLIVMLWTPVGTLVTGFSYNYSLSQLEATFKVYDKTLYNTIVGDAEDVYDGEYATRMGEIENLVALYEQEYGDSGPDGTPSEYKATLEQDAKYKAENARRVYLQSRLNGVIDESSSKEKILQALEAGGISAVMSDENLNSAAVYGWLDQKLEERGDASDSGMYNDYDFSQSVADAVLTSMPLQDLVTTLTDMNTYTALVGDGTDSNPGFVYQVMDVLTPVAIAVMLVAFFVSLLNLVIGENLTLEMFVKAFAMLALGIVAIQASYLFFAGCNGLSGMTRDAIEGVHELGSAFGFSYTGSSEFTNVNEAMADFTLSVIDSIDLWYERLIFILSMKIMQLCQVIASIFLLTLVLSRAIEIGVRGCFLPIAMGLASEGISTNSASVRYVKKLFALFLQGPCILLISDICSSLEISVLMIYFNNVSRDGGGGSAGSLMLLAIAFPVILCVAQIGASRGSIHILNDVMGC